MHFLSTGESSSTESWRLLRKVAGQALLAMDNVDRPIIQSDGLFHFVRYRSNDCE
jgi:hypothetical protein